MFKDKIYDQLMWVDAKKFVFVGAGSLGTTEIMLRSKELGLHMSDKVGHDMSGNGDILAFGYACPMCLFNFRLTFFRYNLDEEVNAIGREAPLPDRPVGPTITGIL